MIIKKIRLFPFAGITDIEIIFEKGLNVISGPNEAGKSTIVRALLFAFFTPTKLTPANEKKVLADVLPVAGGDTVKINLEFEAEGINYTLEKSWGGSKNSILQINNGKSLNDPTTVQNKIEEILDLNEATWKNMLFAHQATLDKTIKNIQDKEILNSFSGLLRGAVMAQGGVSSDELKSTLTGIIDKGYFGAWDRSNDCPANARGINNKAINNVGKILESYYLLEEAKRDLGICSDYELKIDSMAKNINELSGTVSVEDTFVKGNEEVVKDARERQKLDGDLKVLKISLDGMKKDQVEWPKVSARVDGNLKTFETLQSAVKALKSELLNAETKDSAKGKIEKFNSIITLQGELRKAEEEFAKVQKVYIADLSLAVAHEKKINESLITLKAQKLKIALVAKKNFKATLNKGISEVEEKVFNSGEQLEIDVAGKFGFETEYFSLNVVSGNEDIQLLSEQISDSEKELNLIFKKYKVKDLVNLNMLAETEKVKKIDVEQKMNSLKTFLGKDDIDTLKEETETVKSLPSVRETSVLREELGIKNTEYGILEVTQKNDRETLEKHVLQYDTLEKLNETLLDKNTDKRALDNQLNNLKPLPEGVTSADDFVKDFDIKKNQCQLSKNELNDLILKKTAAEKEEPAKTSQELNQEITLHQKEFDRAKLEGLAYIKILDNLNEILKAESDSVFNPYYNKTKKYFAELTGGKYTSIDMDSIVPSGISDGTITLKPNMLSQGTKDSLALALRLSMADYYLEGSDGFIVMDDPLTDMDSTRQKLAADCIKKFAANKQVILFTCHESHDKILEGHTILLNENSLVNN